jgi:hypothetical protein
MCEARKKNISVDIDLAKGWRATLRRIDGIETLTIVSSGIRLDLTPDETGRLRHLLKQLRFYDDWEKYLQTMDREYIAPNGDVIHIGPALGEINKWYVIRHLHDKLYREIGTDVKPFDDFVAANAEYEKWRK